MRRLVSISLIAVLALTAAAAPAVLAKGKAAKAPKPAPAITLKAVAGSALPGERLPVQAMLKVKGKKAVRITSATAVIHFASGDVTVSLVKAGGSNGMQVKGRALVGADEAPGTVVIDVTAVVNGVTYTARATATVEAPELPDPEPSDPADDPGDDPTEVPSEAPSSDPTDAPVDPIP